VRSPKVEESKVEEVEVSNDEKFTKRIAAFAQNVSGFLRDVLSEQLDFVGVALGTTLRGAIDGLSDMDVTPSARQLPVWFVPTCGETLGEETNTLSSSWLALNLDKLVNKRADCHFSLRGVMNTIPVDASAIETDTIRTFVVERADGWQRIFGEPDAAVEKLDAIMTSLAPSDQEGRLLPRELAKAGITEKEFIQHVWYDIGGVYIPRNENDARVRLWNERSTGIKMKHYDSCAVRALAKDTPGVIVLAIWENKGEVVLDAVNRGLINTLVIDESLGEKLLSLAAQKA
jgi:DNA-binding transcriptional regulator LsrR (DeoR family)